MTILGIVFLVLAGITVAAPLVFGIIEGIRARDLEEGVEAAFSIGVRCLIAATILFCIGWNFYYEKAVTETGYTRYEMEQINFIEHSFDNNESYFVRYNDKELFDIISGVLYHQGKVRTPLYNADGSVRNVYQENNIPESERLSFCLEQAGITKK